MLNQYSQTANWKFMLTKEDKILVISTLLTATESNAVNSWKKRIVTISCKPHKPAITKSLC